MASTSMTTSVIPKVDCCSWQGIGERVNWFSHFLTKPIYRTTEWMLHSVTPIRVGKFGNASNYYTELLCRIILCAFAILLVPINIPLWVGAGFLDFIAENLKSQPFSHLYGKGSSSGSSQTIYSLNTCMFWGGLPIPFGGVRPAVERIDAMAAHILEQDPQILCLQELSYEPALLLWEKIKHRYTHGFTRIAPSPWLGMESALFLATKEPLISKPEYFPLPYTGTIKRGVFILETAKTWLMTTHLNAGTSEQDQEVRRKQLHALGIKIAELKKKKDKPCLLVGDLNIQRTSGNQDEYSLSGLSDLFSNPEADKELSLTSATCTNVFTADAFGSKRPTELHLAYEKIDYALVDKGSQLPLAVVLSDTYDTTTGRALSDHRGVLVTIRA